MASKLLPCFGCKLDSVAVVADSTTAAFALALQHNQTGTVAHFAFSIADAQQLAEWIHELLPEARRRQSDIASRN